LSPGRTITPGNRSDLADQQVLVGSGSIVEHVQQTCNNLPATVCPCWARSFARHVSLLG
jgi:hypothetical protein